MLFRAPRATGERQAADIVLYSGAMMIALTYRPVHWPCRGGIQHHRQNSPLSRLADGDIFKKRELLSGFVGFWSVRQAAPPATGFGAKSYLYMEIHTSRRRKLSKRGFLAGFWRIFGPPAGSNLAAIHYLQFFNLHFTIYTLIFVHRVYKPLVEGYP